MRMPPRHVLVGLKLKKKQLRRAVRGKAQPPNRNAKPKLVSNVFHGCAKWNFLRVEKGARVEFSRKRRTKLFPKSQQLRSRMPLETCIRIAPTIDKPNSSSRPPEIEPRYWVCLIVPFQSQTWPRDTDQARMHPVCASSEKIPGMVTQPASVRLDSLIAVHSHRQRCFQATCPNPIHHADALSEGVKVPNA